MSTSPLGVSSEALRARADSSVTRNTAQGVRSTGVGRVARIRALAVDAGEIRRTVRAGTTSKNTSHTFTNLLAVAVLVSSAQRLTDSVVTNLVDQTCFIVEAHILAELPVADLSFWALCVCRTRFGLLDTTNNWGWVWNKGSWAGALRPVVDHLTLGVRATRVANTRICAPVVDASV